MSTSDAGELQLRAAPPAHRTTPTAPTHTERQGQDKTGVDRFQPKNHTGHETQRFQDHHRPAFGQDGAQRASICGEARIRQQEAAYCSNSEAHVQKPYGPRFTSSVFVTFSRKGSIDKSNVKVQPEPVSCPGSVTEQQTVESEDVYFEVTGQTSPQDFPAETTSDHPQLSREKDVITAGCNLRHWNVNHTLSNGNFGAHKCNSLHVLPHETHPTRTCFGLIEAKENIASDQTSMLSSTMVSVLAPHWSGRIRRNKRFEGATDSESQGNFQDMARTVINRGHNQHGHERLFMDGSQSHERVPFIGTRSNTVGWSTNSGPARLDCDSKRNLIQTVSLDVNSGRMDNRTPDRGSLSPVTPTASPLSPLYLNQNEQIKNTQSGNQGVHSSSSSKPTTSSLLLSLRRMNPTGKSSNTSPGFSEENHAPKDQQGNFLSTPLPQSNNNNVHESQSVVSPKMTPYRTTENGPLLSPTSPHHRQGLMSESHLFSPTSVNKATGDRLFTQHTQTCSKHASLNREASVRPQNCSDTNKNPNIYPDRLGSTLKHSSYDTSNLMKSHTNPRRTTLTSTSWWKQVTQDGSSSLSPNVTPNIKDQPNPASGKPCNNISDLPTPVSADNNRFRSQIPHNANNNISESAGKGNVSLVHETQGGILNLTQRNARDLSEQTFNRQFQQYASTMNNRDQQKPPHVDDVSSRYKISRDTPQTTLTHVKDLSKASMSNCSPTEIGSKYSGAHGSSKTSISPISPHNMYSDFPKHSNYPTSPLTSLSPTTPNSKPNSFFRSDSVSSLTNIHTSSNTGTSSPTSKITHKSSATPLGFERSYAPISKHIPQKTSFILAAGASNKTSYSPAATASVTSSTIGSRTTTTTVPTLSLLTPPVTPSPTAIPHSSFPTPPATPVNKSPSCLKSSSPKEGMPSSLEKDSKAEGKKARRVTWGDTVDQQSPQPITTAAPDPFAVSPNSVAPSSSPLSGRAPLVFNFTRSSSPTMNTTALSSTSPKTNSIQADIGAKYRSMSSDSADLTFREQERPKQGPANRMISDRTRQDLNTNRKERAQSFESGTVQCHSSISRSLPPDFSSGYKLRYSSPPYSSLKSSRLTQGDPVTKPLRSQLFSQASQSTYFSERSLHACPSSAMTPLTSKNPVTQPRVTISPPETSTLPSQNPTSTHENSKSNVSETAPIKTQSKNISNDVQTGQVLFVNNRVDVSSTCSQDDEADKSSTCVTETLVYSIKTRANSALSPPNNGTPKNEQHSANTEVLLENKLSQQPHTSQSKEVSGGPNQSPGTGSAAESGAQGDESCNKTTKDSVLSKSRLFSVESNNEQSPKKSRFALKKSVSIPSSSLSRSETERASKTNNKMDQVLNKLRQTFSTRRSDDDLSFPWKWKRASQTPSVSGSSDISNVSDVPADCTKMQEQQEQERGSVEKEKLEETKAENSSNQNRYTIVPPAGDKFSNCSEIDEYETSAGYKSKSATQDTTDFSPSNQFSSSRDPSPGRNPSPCGDNPAQFRKSTSSPRSPFSPFSSLTPVSQFSSPDVTDDSVFYSPKVNHRRNSPSPCELGEGMSLGTSRSRASTGPPSPGTGQDTDSSLSSCADIKYGIVPGRSFSVSSVLSSRPSGPGRISKGSRVMSVGDLCKSSATRSSSSGENLDQWPFAPNLPTDYDCQPLNEGGMSNSGKIRSRSLPRSFASSLANWRSGVFDSEPGNIKVSKSANRWDPNMNICDLEWDAEGPPTPPPTPPLSPVSRRISKAPTSSSPTFPSPPGAPQSQEGQSTRGHLPSRGYRSSLTTFEESDSDSSSDTTTDDEYYLETGDGEEKETEL